MFAVTTLIGMFDAGHLWFAPNPPGRTCRPVQGLWNSDPVWDFIYVVWEEDDDDEGPWCLMEGNIRVII